MGDAAAPDDSPQSVAPRLAAFMRRFVRLRSANEPVVLLLDDAHWIDRASDELVREVGASVRDTRTLLLANFRPEYRPAWIGGSHYQQLALSPLGEEASRELVQDLLGSDGSLDEVSDLIRERTGGNPFFTEEVVHALAASGSLIGERGAYRLTAPVDTLALPETVQSLLAARIDRLGEQAKHLLQAAAVIGKQFDEPLLGEVSGLDGRDLGAALGALQDGEFVRLVAASPRPEYAFEASPDARRGVPVAARGAPCPAARRGGHGAGEATSGPARRARVTDRPPLGGVRRAIRKRRAGSAAPP